MKLSIILFFYYVATSPQQFESNSTGRSSDFVASETEENFIVESSSELETEENFTEIPSEFVSFKPRILNPRDLKYFLYTRKNPINGEILLLGDRPAIQNSNFDKFKPLRIIIHGFDNNYASEINVELRDVYLEAEDVNVIIVDWSAAAGTILVEYFEVVKQVPDVAKYFAQFYRYLITFGDHVMANILENTIVVGFSLGAHIAGIAGKDLRSVFNRSFKTIVGLDPAAPGFDFENQYKRLASSDADYVIVIHTCMIGLGFKEPIGHVDYYPNFADFQPGCFVLDLICHHARSWKVNLSLFKTE